MKKLLIIFLFCISIVAFSQDKNRVSVKGRVVLEGPNLKGVLIFNNATHESTLTNNDGEFTIPVAFEDVLRVKALNHDSLNVTINKAIIASKKMSIYLIEELIELDEIVINKKHLTGDILTDIKGVKTFKPKLNAFYLGIKHDESIGLSNKPITTTENLTIASEDHALVNGLNMVNVVDQLLLPLFRAEVTNTAIPKVAGKHVQTYLGSQFLEENFNIPEEKVDAFIHYVEQNGLNLDLLNYGNEIELLELLSKKSKSFLLSKDK
ncbi:hypothetical protein N9901_02295 [Flavobacteriaceae bacterium]|nr:hypothetical protein [Flavobacteriaceae bacterium]